MKETMKMIPLEQISRGTLNNRGSLSIDETADAELRASIQSVGIINPITVRPTGKNQYELVCGERRLNAAKALEMTDIPCTVKELDDQQSIEMIIVENLQRKDIHPLDESRAYRMLMDQYGYRPVDIAEKFGKSHPYVLVRIRLFDLIEPVKELLAKNTHPIGVFDRIARLEPVQQQEVYDRMLQYQANSVSVKTIEQYITNNFTLELDNAPFDILSDELYPGSCETCPKNTKNELLFSEFNSGAKCLDRSCFSNKKVKSIKLGIKKVLEETPEIPIAVLPNIGGETINVTRELNEVDVKPLYIDTDITLVYPMNKPEKPKKPVRKDFDSKEDFEEALLDYSNEAEEYEEMLRDYNEEQKDLAEKLKDGRIFKVHVPYHYNNDKTGIQYAMYKAKSGQKGISFSASPDAVNITEVEINKLLDKHKRNQELAFNKTYERAYKLLQEKEYVKVEMETNTVEKDAVVFLTLLKGRYELKKEIIGDCETFEEISAKIRSLSDVEREKIFRGALLATFRTDPDSSYSRGESGYIVAIADSVFPEDMKVIHDEEQAVVQKRKASIDKRIAELSASTDNKKEDEPAEPKAKKAKKKAVPMDPDPEEYNENEGTVVNSDLVDEFAGEEVED